MIWWCHVQDGKLDAAIESLLNYEKHVRLAADVPGTRKVVLAIIQLCYEAKAWKTLNEQILLLSKRRSQLKQASVTDVPTLGLVLTCLHLRGITCGHGGFTNRISSFLSHVLKILNQAMFKASAALPSVIQHSGALLMRT